MTELKLSISDIKKHYTEIDVSNYNKLIITGYQFPITPKDVPQVTSRPLKKPETHEGMVAKLKEHGVIIQSDDESKLIELLKVTNYYKLSIFIKLLDANKNLSCLLQLYEFDNFLKHELTPLLKDIENLFKTNLTYYLVNNYESFCNSNCTQSQKQHCAECYLDYGIYDSKNKDKITEILSKFAESALNKRKKELYIEHHIKNYGGHIPLWVLIETLTFGEIVHFYSFLSSNVRKEWKNSFFNVPVIKESEIEWLKTLQFLRNDCAHDNRLYGKTFNFSPLIHKKDLAHIFGEDKANLHLLKKRKVPMSRKLEFDELNKQIEKSKKTLFTALIIMRYFIEASSQRTQENWNTFLAQLENEIKTKNIPLFRIGFKHNWKDLLQLKSPNFYTETIKN